MKANYQRYKEFIVEQRSFFEDALLPEVNKNVPKSDQLAWDSNQWQYGGMSSGFLSGALQSINFDVIKVHSIKGLFDKDEKWDSKVVNLTETYSEFVKAYCTFINHRRSPSGMVVLAQQLLLKRVYVRMIMAGVEPHPVNITSEFLQRAVDLLASSRTGKSARSNAAKDYDDASVIARNLNYIGFPLVQVEITKKEKVLARTMKNEVEIDNQIETAEDLDKDDHDKNLSIQTFLNVVALRGMVKNDGEKVVLNLVLLLMVTGFRHMEAATIRYGAFKVVEIESEMTRRQLEKRGIPSFYVGIRYLAEKRAGYRTHWIEPLAVELIEDVLVNTLVLTETIRTQLEHMRRINFVSFLPQKYFSPTNDDNIAQLNSTVIDLDEIVESVYESYARTVQKRGKGSARDYATKKIKNSKLGIQPIKEEVLRPNNKKRIWYSLVDIDKFIRASAVENQMVAIDFKHRTKDSATGSVQSIPYEDLLFIIPQGSGAVRRTAAMKCIPQMIDKVILEPFLGYGSKRARQNSIFAKYGLVEQDGQFTFMYSHTPRHAINTFFAITGISEHLQAMFMGRKDFTQNETYQHLAIQEKVICSS
ncbi:hypothetical protein [Vibrio sp. Vb339]|uniref:hypothetical protein n=1 Tax=Vibrio sp. Vb339 TaxID=1192013 RepID=UPI0015530E4E|nr:hypothetical protein [Vibrio sp. Vb339]